MKTNTVFNCPLCNAELSLSVGNVFHPDDINFGLTLYCANVACEAEVFGHTNTSKRQEAFETIQDKYIARKK